MTSIIKATRDSIRSAHDGGVGNWILKEWVIDGSSDNTFWIELDRRTNNSELNGRNLIVTFTLNR
jgi:hypothetical protein